MTESTKKLQDTPESAGSSSRLNSLVDQAGSLMDQLSEMSETQSQAIQAVDIDKIVEYVSRREPVIGQLVIVGEEIEAIISTIDQRNQSSSVSYKAALAKITTIEHAMKRLREQDARDQQSMEAAREKLSDQMASSGTNQSALRAYSAKPATPNPILQDRQG